MNTTTRKHKVRKSVHFHRPTTLKLKRTPRYERQIKLSENISFDEFALIRRPIKTDSTTTLMEENNILVFIVAKTANKHLVSDAFKKVYGFKPTRVNTMITPLGEKKAYVHLPANQSAVEVASQIGLA
eukprot:gnl/Dysnectes_brevis/91_a110_7908.p1 GENE.gnl/Dysnectes_brevis/91_a110_7908~~gnl/Dysnectes_brevis/91_a110_7908.p1  ORF type:complete len:128 (-),score=43.02 gnl/Dysnectes_brevis/91_a110_7908:52-435(-)